MYNSTTAPSLRHISGYLLQLRTILEHDSADRVLPCGYEGGDVRQGHAWVTRTLRAIIHTRLDQQSAFWPRRIRH